MGETVSAKMSMLLALSDYSRYVAEICRHIAPVPFIDEVPHFIGEKKTFNEKMGSIRWIHMGLLDAVTRIGG